jgi:hypothetical protein
MTGLLGSLERAAALVLDQVDVARDQRKSDDRQRLRRCFPEPQAREENCFPQREPPDDGCFPPRSDGIPRTQAGGAPRFTA